MALPLLEENDHGACVNAWMERSAKDLPPERLLWAFEQAFAVLWRRAHRTLGGVTLAAIADRVIYVSAERHPMFSSLKLGATELRCDELRQQAGSLDADQLAEGVRFVLLEFLTVLGNLTADILTPALHAELSKLLPEHTSDAGEQSQGEPIASQGEDAEGTEP